MSPPDIAAWVLEDGWYPYTQAMSQFVALKQIVYMVCGVNSFTVKSNSNSPELVKLWSDCAMSPF